MKIEEERLGSAIKLANELAVKEGLQTVGYPEYWYKFSAYTLSTDVEDAGRLYLILKYGCRHKWTKGTTLYIDLSNFRVVQGWNDDCDTDEHNRMKQIANKVMEYLKEIE
jgi:hypothetical protein